MRRRLAAALLALGLALPLAATAEEALRPLEERVRGGDPDAAILLARRHEYGLGVPVDLGRAAELYCDAALRGREEAALRLASMFLEGEGVALDIGVAARWIALAQRAWRPPPSRAPCAAGPALSVGPAGDLPRLVRAMAARQGVEPALAIAVVAAESAFRPEAVSPRGARGLMQLMPRTAAELAVADPHDPRDNLAGGLALLRRLLARFGGDVVLALAAYNAGEGAVARWGGVPPFAETEAFIARVLRLRERVRD